MSSVPQPAAGVELATLCFNLGAYILKHPSDNRLAVAIHVKSIAFISEIDGVLLRLPPETRNAAKRLQEQLRTIIEDIERNGRRARYFRIPLRLRLTGSECRERVCDAFDLFQMRVTVSSCQLIEELRKPQPMEPRRKFWQR